MTSEAWSWSALGPRIQETDCAGSGTGAPHLWAPGPGRTRPLRAKQPGGSGAKPYSLSTSDRTASTPPYWQKWSRIMAKIKTRNLAAWRTQIKKKCQDKADVKLSQFLSAVQRALHCLRSIIWEWFFPGYTLNNFFNELNPAGLRLSATNSSACCNIELF